MQLKKPVEGLESARLVDIVQFTGGSVYGAMFILGEQAIYSLDPSAAQHKGVNIF